MRRLCLGVLFCLSVMSFLGCTTMETSSVSAQDFNKHKPSSGLTKLVDGDTIEVSVEVDGNMEVSLHRAKLNHFGVVTLPLVGDVNVGGLFLSEARQKITMRYSKFYINPPVTMVSLVDDGIDEALGFVTVLGRVIRPGRVAMTSPRGTKLSEAIQESGGFSSSAKQSDIRISRIDKKGKKLQVSIDFREIGKQGNVDADINLMDGDIIYVPERIF